MEGDMEMDGGDSHTTLWIPLTHTLKNGQNGQFCMYFTTKNIFNR